MLLVEIAEVTPPVGFNLFVLQNMTGQRQQHDRARLAAVLRAARRVHRDHHRVPADRDVAARRRHGRREMTRAAPNAVKLRDAVRGARHSDRRSRASPRSAICRCTSARRRRATPVARARGARARALLSPIRSFDSRCRSRRAAPRSSAASGTRSRRFPSANRAPTARSRARCAARRAPSAARAAPTASRS